MAKKIKDSEEQVLEAATLTIGAYLITGKNGKENKIKACEFVLEHDNYNISEIEAQQMGVSHLLENKDAYGLSSDDEFVRLGGAVVFAPDFKTIKCELLTIERS